MKTMTTVQTNQSQSRNTFEEGDNPAENRLLRLIVKEP